MFTSLFCSCDRDFQCVVGCIDKVIRGPVQTTGFLKPWIWENIGCEKPKESKKININKKRHLLENMMKIIVFLFLFIGELFIHITYASTFIQLSANVIFESNCADKIIVLK